MPVVVVDTVAMPGEDWFDKVGVDEEAYVPVKDIEAVDGHRSCVW